jgi:hypothetical protein
MTAIFMEVSLANRLMRYPMVTR